MTVQRIQLRRTKGWRMPPDTLKADRTTMWGNPFAHQDPAIAVRMFRAWLIGSMRTATIFDCTVVLPGDLASRRARMRAELPMLRGYSLACWCRPGAPCHADVLLELANKKKP